MGTVVVGFVSTWRGMKKWATSLNIFLRGGSNLNFP